MSNPITMDAELPAYLLERKMRSLKTLLREEGSSDRGARAKISNVINILGQISESARIANVLPENVNRILKVLRDLDDESDMFLLRREKSCNGYCWSPCRRSSLVCALLKFVKAGIIQILPAAGSAGMMSSPSEPLLAMRPPDDWTSIWGDQLIPHHNRNGEKDKTEDGLFSGLVNLPAKTKNHVLFLHGSRGEGKTTLTRYLYDRVDIMKEYPCRAWVSIHEDSRYKDVLLELIEQVGVTGVVIDPTKEEDKLAEELFQLLSKPTTKKYLIVLDDCNTKIWPKLMECLPERKKGRVVITTPLPIEEFMENGGNIEPRKPDFVSVIEMHRSEFDRWKFLLNLVNKKWVGRFAEQLQIHVEHSSPRALVLLAGGLRAQQPDQIQGAVDSLMAHIQQVQDQRMSSTATLKWSYQDMHPLAKACLLFLTIFPKGSEVPMRRVRYLWLSEGFLDDEVANRGSPPFPGPTKNLAMMLFGILVNRKLVDVTKWKLDGSPKTCRIPIFVHDFASKTLGSTSLFNVYNQHTVGEASVGEGSHVRRLAFHGECGIPRRCVHGDLRTYVSFPTKTGGKLNIEIDVHLKTLTEKHSCALLKLLDLEGVYKPNLPGSISNLLYLRFLGLRSTKLDSLPTSVAKLQCLETIDLKHTHVINLPSSLLKSKKLRHLHAKEVALDDFITEPCQSECLPRTCLGGNKSSSNLETLTGLYIRSEVSMATGSHIFNNLQKLNVTFDVRNPRSQSALSKDIKDFIVGMPNLQSLKLNSKDTTQAYSVSFSGHRNLEKIHLCCKLEDGGEQCANQPAQDPPHPLRNRLPGGLRELTLSMSKLVRDPMPVLGELNSLAVLRLLSKSYMSNEMKCTGFPALRVLKIWKLPGLVTLKVQPGSMPCLEEMELRKCPSMRRLRGSQNLECNIKLLVLCDMPRIFNRYIEGKQISQKTTIVKTST